MDMASRTTPITLPTWWCDGKRQDQKEYLSMLVSYGIWYLKYMGCGGEKRFEMNAASSWPVKNSSNHQTCKW